MDVSVHTTSTSFSVFLPSTRVTEELDDELDAVGPSHAGRERGGRGAGFNLGANVLVGGNAFSASLNLKPSIGSSTAFAVTIHGWEFVRDACSEPLIRAAVVAGRPLHQITQNR